MDVKETRLRVLCLGHDERLYSVFVCLLAFFSEKP